MGCSQSKDAVETVPPQLQRKQAGHDASITEPHSAPNAAAAKETVKVNKSTPDGSDGASNAAENTNGASSVRSAGTQDTHPSSVETPPPPDVNSKSGRSSVNNAKSTTPPPPAPPSSPPSSSSGGYNSDTGGASSSAHDASSGYMPTGYSSGASTPTQSLDGSWHGNDGHNGSSSRANGNPKTLVHSSSVLGLDDMMEKRKEEGDLKSNVVHIEVPFGKPIEEVYDGVHTGPVLGSGISGLVRLVTHKATGVKYAVKCLDLGLVETDEGLQQLREEIFIMCQLDHPNIVRLEEVYESHSEIYLVQELCLGGELFDRLDEQPDYHYTEAQCARLVKQMLGSVRYLHSKGIIHRDLKLENFLFSSTSPDSELKMIDFGLSKHFKFGEVQHEAVGTPYTVSPEVIRGSYDERCDIWAIGVITFLLLSGDPPFGGCGGPEPLMTVRSNILRGAFRFEPEDIWANVSGLARDFIRTLLVTDPNQRPTAREAQKHKWLREWANREKKDGDNILNPNVFKALVTFKEYSDMRKLLCEVLSFTLLPEQIKELRREFEKMDTDGSGEISLSALKQVLIENAGAGSLGALTEEEVEDIFNAMRVRKSETRIHWHEFIAAGLSQCKVDDRNLRLAFDRLDNDHKGYITFENVMDLMGNDGAQSEDAMRRMWGDSMKACNCHHARITYDDFLLLMKGQTKDGLHDSGNVGGVGVSAHDSGHLPISMTGPSSRDLHVVHEVHEVASLGDATAEEEEKHRAEGDGETSANPPADTAGGDVVVLPSGDKVVVEGGSAGGVVTIATVPTKSFDADRRGSLGSINSTGSLTRPPPNHKIAYSAPNTPMYNQSMPILGVDTFDDSQEGPLTMDDGPLMMDDEEMDAMISAAADKGILLEGSNNNLIQTDKPSPPVGGRLTPPQSPMRGPTDFITPMSDRPAFKLSQQLASSQTPPLPGRPSNEYIRRRSRSVDDQDTSPVIDDDESGGGAGGEKHPHFNADARRAMLLPEHSHQNSDIEQVIKDETITPLVVNRKLYRAHRQMRLAVLEASKRFEEEQARRARDILKAQREAQGISNSGNGSNHPVGAGLVMRHGHMKELSSESIRAFLKQSQKQQQTLVDKANKRGGRGRSRRKKTTSDMTGMLSLSSSGTGAEELLMAQPAPPPPSPPRPAVTTSALPTLPNLDVPPSPGGSAGQIREATVPGVFRKTQDPFKATGKYFGVYDSTGSNNSTFQAAASAAVASTSGEGGNNKDDLINSSHSSRHSMKGSASDGDLKKEVEASPASTASPATQNGSSGGVGNGAESGRWPPPPPL